MRKRFVPIAIVALIAILAVVGASFVRGGFGQANTQSPTTSDGAARTGPARPGEQAPVFTATDVTGEQVSLADLAGKQVWLVFRLIAFGGVGGF